MSRSKIKGQGHQGQKRALSLPSPPAAHEWYALAANNVTQQRTAPFRRCRGVSAACMRCMFHKNLYSVALVFLCNLLNEYHLTDRVIFFTQNVNQRTLGKAHTSSTVSLTARGWCAIPTKGPFNTRERAYSRESVAMELIESNDDVQVQTARIRACPRGVKAFRACPC